MKKIITAALLFAFATISIAVASTKCTVEVVDGVKVTVACETSVKAGDKVNMETGGETTSVCVVDSAEEGKIAMTCKDTLVKVSDKVTIEAAPVHQASTPVYFKAPMDFVGTGCPEGSATVTGENSPTLTVIFKKYDAAKPNSKAQSGFERASCNVAVPIHVPQGYQVSVMTAEWVGHAEGNTEFSRRYFFAGLPDPILTSKPSGKFV